MEIGNFCRKKKKRQTEAKMKTINYKHWDLVNGDFHPKVYWLEGSAGGLQHLSLFPVLAILGELENDPGYVFLYWQVHFNSY